MRIKNKRDLPAWATPAEYSVFAKMNDNDFMWQIIIRYLDAVDGYDNNIDYFDEVVKCAPDRSILKKTYSGHGYGSVGPYQKISEELVVKPLSVYDIAALHDNLMDFDVVSNKIFDGERCVNREQHTHVDVYLKKQFDKLIHCSLDLGLNDEVIISSLSRLLPLWRKQLKIEKLAGEREIKTAWPINRNKMISYQAFLFYDLIRWQLASGKKITTSIIAATLYPDGEYGEIAINQTIKNYVEKIFSINYVEFLFTELNSNGQLI